MRKRRTSTTVERESIVAAYEASGQTRRSFAKANGLKVSTLDSWRRAAVRRGFVEIAVAGAQQAQPELRIALGNGWRVEFQWSEVAEAARQGEALRTLLLALDGAR